MGWLTVIFKVKLNLKVKIYPIFGLWVCLGDKSIPNKVRLSKFGPKMHLSTVKVPIDFGIDWSWSSVSFLTSNLLYSTKYCVSLIFASFCIYLVRPSPLSVPHPTWLRTYTDSYACGQGPAMDRETVYLYILVRPLEFTFISWWDHWSSASLASAIGTGFYKLLLVFAMSYTLRLSKFYMPTLINHRNNSKKAPISLYFVRPSSLLQRYF